ncbi:flagellar assembly protein FliW [Paenibacillus hodogayensis]|uniref:Flagellar assembly factor FliW n=1 Tax=Paenibacillus hodogayensis TaxID=279208 RepID=A0ABV5W7M7_9BACL
MIIQTLRFGELDVQPENMISFEQGLPGFEQLRLFSILTPDPELPFSFMQSMEDGNVAFVIVNPFLFYPHYEFELPEEVQDSLKLERDQDVAVWAIVSLKEEMAASTLNLLAPVIINMKEGLGKQCILHGSGYTTKHPLAAPVEAEKGKEVGDTHARIDT